MALERRTSAESKSPRSRKISASRFTVAMNQITSPALARAINSLSPDCSVLRERTNRSASQILACSSAAFRVGLDDLGRQQQLAPIPRQSDDRLSHRSIDLLRCVDTEMTGGLSYLARAPGTD